MKITLVGPVYPYRGGIAHYTTALGEAFQSRHTLQLISFKRQYPAWLYPGQSDRDPSLEPMSIQAEFSLDPLNPYTWRISSRRIETFGPQIVVLQWWSTYWAPAFGYLARRLGSHGHSVVYLIHNVLPHEAHPWDRWLTQMALRPATAFIVHTSREGERLQGILPGSTITICPHPIYDLFAGRHASQAEARASLGLPIDVTVILFFGIVRPYKGLQSLLEALSKLQFEDLDLRLLVAGEIWGDPSVYQRQIDSFSLGERVQIDNRYIPNEEVSLYFSAADLFVAPYTGGTASGATKLALGFGLPVVVTRNIVDETLQKRTSQDVFIAEPDDPQDLSRAIRAALSVLRAGNLSPTRNQESGWADMVRAIENASGRARPPQVDEWKA